MTKRQWITLQHAPLDYLTLIERRGVFSWDRRRDGPPPTEGEIHELARLVGDTEHDE